MIVEMQEFMSEQSQALADQAHQFRKNPERFVRKVLIGSAERFKALKSPVRKVAHSGVKFTTVSQNALQSLIELQVDVVTSALTAAAMRCERAAEAETFVDLMVGQTEMLGATRDRVVDEATRAVKIFKVAGRDLRKVGMHLYEMVSEPVEVELPKAKAAGARKTKRVVRKAERTVRKTAARVRKVVA